MTQAPTASLALTPAGGKDFASSVIYQVYPKSFYSSAGGAYGDLRGIIEKEGGKVVGLVIALNRQEKGNDSDLSAVQQIEKQREPPQARNTGLSAVPHRSTEST